MKLTNKQLAEWAVSNGVGALYRDCDDFDPGDDFSGAEPGPNGGRIHLISQSETQCVYAETTDDVDDADYLVADMTILTPGTLEAAAIELLDMALGDQCTWPDNYAQTRGWVL